MIRLSSSGALFALAKEASDSPERSRSLVAIVFSVAAVEAWLNELLDLAQDDANEAALVRLSAAVGDLSGRNVSLGLKLQITYLLLAERPLSRGSLPYQDFDLLVGVRNALIHMRSETLEYGPSESTEKVQHRLAKQLVNRHIVKAPGARTILPLMSALEGQEVGQWAYATATAVTRQLVELMPEGNVRDSMALRSGLLSAADFNSTVA